MRGGRGAKEAKDVGDVFQEAEPRWLEELMKDDGRKRFQRNS